MLNVAIIGAGIMGRVHGNGYRNVRNCKVNAVYDLNEEKAGNIASPHGAKICTDYNQILEDERIDMVDICLPTYLHREFAIPAMRKKKHVFCEKPIALTIEDAQAMEAEADFHKVNFSVGHVVRYFPAYKRASQLISEGKIGKPGLIRTTRTGAYPLRPWQDWYSDYELSGGLLLDLVIHDFDWILNSFGEIERLYAKRIKNGGRHRQDHCLVVLRLKNGTIAHVEGSWAYPPGTTFGTTFEVIGTKGQIEFDSRESAPVKMYVNNENNVRITAESPLFPDEEPYTAELQEFVDAIISNRKPVITASAATKALAVSLAAIESEKTGRPVVLGV